MGRRRPDWIEGWLEYTDVLPSPSLWRKWAGIFILGAALERRVWVRTAIGPLYPNLYVLLVGPPGLGKTNLTSKVHEFLTQLSGLATGNDPSKFHLAASSETHASLVDALKDAGRRYIDPKTLEPVSFHSLTIVSNELGVFLPEWSTAMMNKLQDLYDCKPYSERRRTGDLYFEIAKPQLSFISGTTPSFLTETLPPGAWDQGFISRTMIAFSTETLKRDIFTESPFMETVYNDLIVDLHHIFSLHGQVVFEDDAIDAIRNWDAAGQVPLPEHPKLLHYNTRRMAHLLKLCLIVSISEGDSFKITKQHVIRALDLLTELEAFLPEIFKSMAQGGDSKVFEEIWYQIQMLWQVEQKPIHESRITAYIAQRVPSQFVGRVLEVMIATKILIDETAGYGTPGNRTFRPASKPVT